MSVEKSLLEGWEWPQEWKKIVFADALKPVKYTTKIPKSKFGNKGAFPIIDQSDKFIAGYWNVLEDVFKIDRPLIVFGDHTCCFKYIDFDFVLGADGVKLLMPIDSYCPKFFYFMCQNMQIRNLGYSRHYKEIIKKIVPLPPLPKQKRIVAILDAKLAAVEKARQAAEKQLSESRLLSAALLRALFSVDKELPHGWRWGKLGEECDINPKRDKLTRSDEEMTTFIPMPSVDGIKGMATNPLVKAYKDVKRGYTYFREEDVLFAKITPCMQNGKHFIARNLTDKIGFGSTEFHVLRPSESIIPEWVYFFVRQKHILQEAIRHFTGTAGQKRVPDDFLRNLIIPLPSPDEQKRIVAGLGKQLVAANQCQIAAERQLSEINLMPAASLRDVLNGWT